jgi:ribosomal protein S18 acetylase RimI-like enzyme
LIDSVETRAAPGDLTIRRELAPGDFEAVVALHERLYPAEYGVDRGFVDGVQATVDDLGARGGWPGEGEGVWIVERDGDVAGSLMLSDEGAGEGRVRLFLLAPDLRGRGLGRRLLEELLDRAREAGYQCLTLSTFADLKGAAHLYREAGFRVVGEEHGPKWGREDFNFQHYELALDAPGRPPNVRTTHA